MLNVQTPLHNSHVHAWRNSRYSQASAFLRRLDPEAEKFTFQTFDDTGENRSKLARKFHGAFGDFTDELEGLQRDQAGVFVTVNETDLKGRQTSNIKRVRAVFVDLDGAPLQQVLEAGLEPHIVVESSPGKWHCYWLTDDCPLDQFSRVQVALAMKFSGDASVKDLPRVLRLPGFRHFKGVGVTSELHEELCNDLPPYDLAELIGALDLDPREQEVKPEAATNGATGKITPGSKGKPGRNAHLFARGRSMAKGGLSPEGVLAALRAENQTRCDPPLSSGAIEYLAERAFKAKDDPNDWRWRDKSEESTQVDSLGDWQEPEPLSVTVEPQPYPIDALPKTIREAVEEVAAFVKAPIAMVASSALAAVSLAIQSYADARRAEKLQGPTGLFLLTIADSGERKSTCDGYFVSAIRHYEEEQAEAMKPAIKEYQAAFAAWEAEREGILSAIKQTAKPTKPANQKDIKTLRADLAEHQHDEPAAPRIPRLLYADATPEALAFGLAKTWPSGGVVTAEGGAIFGSHGMGKDSVMRNLSLLNQLWDGATLTFDRRTTESFTVRGARLTVALQVQEPTLREFFKQSGPLARGCGFLARFLVSWPESTQGFRPFTEAPDNWPRLAAFNRRIAAILDQPAPIDGDGTLTPAMLALTVDAKEAWVGFHDEIEGELASGGELHDVRDVASKSADNAIRLAALFQVFEGAGGAIGAGAFNSASRIAAWHLNESRRFFGELALPTELADAARLDRWLIEYCQRERARLVPIAKLQQGGPSGLRRKATINAATADLEELCRAREVRDAGRKWIEVNPALLGGES